MIFDSIVMGASQKFPRCSKNKSIKRLFSWKVTIPTWETSVSQRIEMIINSFLWLKRSWKLMWWSIAWQRIHRYIRKFSWLQSLKINNGGIENQQITKITNVEKHRNIRKWKVIDFFVKYQRSSLHFLNINRNKCKIWNILRITWDASVSWVWKGYCWVLTDVFPLRCRL